MTSNQRANPHCLNDGKPCAPNAEGGCVACDDYRSSNPLLDRLADGMSDADDILKSAGPAAGMTVSAAWLHLTCSASIAEVKRMQREIEDWKKAFAAERWLRAADEPDARCISTPDGGCVSDDCMHTDTPTNRAQARLDAARIVDAMSPAEARSALIDAMLGAAPPPSACPECEKLREQIRKMMAENPDWHLNVRAAVTKVVGYVNPAPDAAAPVVPTGLSGETSGPRGLLRHTLDCDLVKYPNCTRCNCNSESENTTL